jgi:nitroreductase
MALLDLDPDQLLTTTRSVRKRLDLERPVERSVIEECLEIAIQAPTGSNMQSWQWVVIGDPEKKKVIADAYGRFFDPYAGAPGRAYDEGDPRAEAQPRVKDSATYLREHFHEVPYLLIPCIEGRPPSDGGAFAQASWWGSVIPAVWSFMLALRARGLGSSWTTLHLPAEDEIAELLGIPFDRYTQVGLFPIAYTKGTDFKPAARVPATELTHWDTW